MSAFTYDESAGARAEAGTVGGHDGRASERGPCERRLRSVREADLSGALADLADDEHAVVSLRETANRTDGATLDNEEAHVLTIDAAGKITNLWDLPVDPEKHDRFFDGR